MIRYDLKCGKGHQFDSWFGSSADFETLSAAGMVACAVCGSSDVSKAVMAPRVASGDEKPSLRGPSSPAEQVLAELRKAVEANAENVGSAFATEARKIHYGEAEERPIFGQAKPEDAKSLVDEGIAVTPLPWRGRKSN